MKRHARHYQTGEAIPDDLISRLKAARRFNQGIDSVEYTASALVESWGPLNADPLPLAKLADLRKAASELVDKVQFDAGPGN